MKNRPDTFRPTFVSFDDKGAGKFAAYESRMEKKDTTLLLTYILALFFTVMTLTTQVNYTEGGSSLMPILSFITMNVATVMWLELCVTNIISGRYLHAAISPVVIIWLWSAVESYTMTYANLAKGPWG